MRVQEILRVVGIGALIAVVLVLKPGPAPGAPNASDPQVTKRPDEVPKNDTVLGTDGALDTKKPESVTVIGGQVTLKSLLLTPPDDKDFKEWKGKGYVDIHKYALASFEARVLTQGKREIQVEVAEQVSAIRWPLKCEGNLGVEGGGYQGCHWAAKSRYETLYLFLWGDLEGISGSLAQNRTKIQPVVDELVRKGYKVYEDGPAPGYSQANIDQAITDQSLAENPRIVIIDKNTTEADLRKYFDRHTVRGVVWVSHGSMEPYVGCPDEDLLKFESRVRTSVEGHPELPDARMFVRDWAGLLSQQQYVPLNFLVISACHSRGFDSVTLSNNNLVWEKTDAGTKARVLANGPLPPATSLTFTHFGALGSFTLYLRVFRGIVPEDLSWLDIPALVSRAKND